MSTVCQVNGTSLMSCTPEAVTKSASDWMSPLPTNGSSAARRARSHSVELADVPLRQRAVLAQPLALGAASFGPNTSIGRDQEHQHDHDPDEFQLELGQRGTGV